MGFHERRAGPGSKIMLTRQAASRGTTSRRGMVLVLVAVLLPVVVGTMALALDGGVLYLQRRQAQSVADAAALAGGYALYNGTNFSVAQGAAVAIAARNGYLLANSAVTQPQSSQVAVTVTSSPPRFFSGLWGSGSLAISASAMAAVN